MTKLKALIVEDELPSAQFLRELLHTYCPNVQVIGHKNNVSDAIVFIENYKPNLVFLDIELPGKNGFSLLSHYDSLDFMVIFTTAYSQYAIKALRASAIDYLIKPIDIDELKNAVQAALRNVSSFNERIDQYKRNIKASPENKKIIIPISRGFEFLTIQNICYCRADGRYTDFYMDDKTKKIASKSISELEDILTDHHFFKIHRSIIINLDKIEKYSIAKTCTVTMTDGANLPVSNSNRVQFEQILKTI